jgi:hypothetical protein
MKIFFQNYAYFGGFLTLCEGHKADEIFKKQNARNLRKQKNLLSLFMFF